MSQIAVCDAVLTVAKNGNLTCSGSFVSVDYLSSVTPFSVADLAVMGIDPITIAYVYSWGFGAVLSSWFLGFIVDICLKLIRKV